MEIEEQVIISRNIMELFSAIIRANNEDYHYAMYCKDYEKARELEKWYYSDWFKFYSQNMIDPDEYVKWLRVNFRKFRKFKVY